LVEMLIPFAQVSAAPKIPTAMLLSALSVQR
jgi:hypothetical protein